MAALGPFIIKVSFVPQLAWLRFHTFLPYHHVFLTIKCHYTPGNVGVPVHNASLWYPDVPNHKAGMLLILSDIFCIYIYSVYIYSYIQKLKMYFQVFVRMHLNVKVISQLLDESIDIEKNSSNSVNWLMQKHPLKFSLLSDARICCFSLLYVIVHRIFLGFQLLVWTRKLFKDVPLASGNFRWVFYTVFWDFINYTIYTLITNWEIINHLKSST